jgi:hypothetical protein
MAPLAILINLFPAILAAVPLRRLWPERSLLGIAAASWLLGQVVLMPCTYALACLLVKHVSPTLTAAGEMMLLLEATVLVVVLIAERRRLTWRASGRPKAAVFGDLVFLALALGFSYALFLPHVYQEGAELYRSALYWDFTAHYPIVQNFVFGDNFPAQDETAAGLPLLYHFYGDLQVALASALGTPLAESFLWVSALSLASLLVLVREFAKDLFRSETAAWSAAAFIVTSSNIRWVFDLVGNACRPETLAPLEGYVHAARHGIAKCSFGDFNVTMFNLFYLVEERHVLFSCALIVLAAMLLRGLPTMTVVRGATLGVLFALFCSWNIFLLPILLLLLLPGVFRQGSGVASVAAIAILLCICAVQAAAVREVVTSSPWFEASGTIPSLNFNFATEDYTQTITLRRFVEYYAFSIGPTVLCALLGMAVLFRGDRRTFWLIGPMLIGTFLLINTVQALPQSIFENHKWVKPWQAVLNVIAAAPIALLCRRFSFPRLLGVFTLVSAMTLSGIAEALPYFTKEGAKRVAEYPSPLIEEIRAKTRPDAVFATSNPREVLLAGRRIYFLNNKDMDGTIPHLRGLNFRFIAREKSQGLLYSAQNAKQLCMVGQKLGVSIVEFSPVQQESNLFRQVSQHTIIRATLERKGAEFVFVSLDFCGDIAATPG